MARMTLSQFFVYRKPVAWTALFATLLWGVFAYRAMPQQQDPIIPIRLATIVTAYPGAEAEKVEQEVTRRVEKQVSQCDKVKTVYSESRQGLSVVFVELTDAVRDPEEVWQDLQGRLELLTDLPTVGSYAVKPQINKDFAESVAVMLTLSSPKASDFEIHERSKSIVAALSEFRQGRPAELRDRRVSAVLVYPNTVGRSYVLWLGGSLLQRLTERGLIEDAHVVEAPGAGCLDFRLRGGRSDNELARESLRWESDTIGAGTSHPDMWRGTLVSDLSTLEERLRSARRDPTGGPDRYSYRDLRRFSDILRDRLKRFPTIGKIDEVGVQEEAIYLYYSSRRFSALDLAPQSVASRLEYRNINLPGGRVETPLQTVVVHPSGEFKNERDVGEVVIDVQDGHPVYLRDMVDIVRGYEDPPNVMVYRTVKVDGSCPPEARMPGDTDDEAAASGDEAAPLPANPKLQTTRAITLAIRQMRGSHIEDFARDVEAGLQSLHGILPADVRIERIHDEPKGVHEKVGQFNRSLIEAVLIVVIIALVFMEWRSAVLVAFAIPVTVAMTLGFCQIVGVDLQQVSIAAMIFALGLLVDDPVVAGDAINREMAHGKPRDVAAWLGPQKLARAILFATVTNCAAFLPLLIVKGRVGDFIYSLPVVVTASLVASRIVSMTFTPLLGQYILKGQKGFDSALADGGRGAGFARFYNRFCGWCLNRKAIVLGVCFAFLAAGAAVLPFIGTSFFPKDFHTVFIVNVTLAEGSPLRQTRDETIRVIREIDRLEGSKIAAYTTFVGQGGPRFWLSVFPEQRSDSYAQILVHTTDKRVTQGVVGRLKSALSTAFPAARVTVEQLETGPPVGVPVQIRLFGDDARALRRMAEDAKRDLREIPGTDNIYDDWGPEVLRVSVAIDPDRANMAGVSNEDVAMLLNTGLSGASPTSLREGDRLIPITFRLRSDERSRVEDIADLDVFSSITNARVPIRQIADFSTQLVSPRINRRDHQRCVTVKCYTAPGVLASSVVGEMQRRLEKESREWAPGCRYVFGGEHEEQVKGFDSVKLALLISLVMIYLALVFQFNSVSKPLVVFAAVPFGLTAGIMGLLPFGAPFGFMAFLGLASLAGVIVSHIIVLFDYIEEARERGEPLRRAVIDSALVRLRPVLVTVLATVGGLIPLALEGGPLWEPMCYVLISGLFLATLVTMVIVPVLYVAFAENLHLIRWEHKETEVPEEKRKPRA